MSSCTVEFSVKLHHPHMPGRLCECLKLESVFVSVFLLMVKSGLVLFGTLMKGNGDKKWLMPNWRHCLCQWAFEVFYQQCTKWLCEICFAGLTELAVEELFFSRCLAQGCTISTVHNLLGMCFLFAAYWSGSHWAFHHTGVISYFISLIAKVFEVWNDYVNMLWGSKMWVVNCPLGK